MNERNLKFAGIFIKASSDEEKLKAAADFAKVSGAENRFETQEYLRLAPDAKGFPYIYVTGSNRLSGTSDPYDQSSRPIILSYKDFKKKYIRKKIG